MQYRLLRNNKESGPYTKAQLEEMGLKPYDLLWIEGRGGAWQYASEIDDLKSIAPVVEEQPYDRFYKGKENHSDTVGSSKQTASLATNTNVTTASPGLATLKPPKPHFRISGDKVIMIDNEALQQPKPLNDALSSFTNTQQPTAVAEKPAAKQEAPKAAQAVGLHWEEMYSDWKTEEKAPEEKSAPAKVQTMEEVRQRYEKSKLKQLDEKQHKTTNSTKQNIMAAVAVIVLALGGYAGYKINQDGGDNNRTTQTSPAVEKAEIVQDHINGQQNTGDAANVSAAAQQPAINNTDEPSSNEIKNTLPADNNKSTSIVPPPVENTGTNTTDKKTEQPVTSAKNIPPGDAVAKADKNSVQQEPLNTKNKANTTSTNNSNTATKEKKEDNTQYDINKTNTSAPVSAPPATEAKIVKQPGAPAKKIGDYISVSKLGDSNNSGSVQNVLLSVKNVTDFPIDLAVIDIQYFGSDGRYQKGETMYVRNIGAGDNVNVRIPDGKTARSINYKVSLVSSEQKTLYLVGD